MIADKAGSCGSARDYVQMLCNSSGHGHKHGMSGTTLQGRCYQATTQEDMRHVGQLRIPQSFMDSVPIEAKAPLQQPRVCVTVCDAQQNAGMQKKNVHWRAGHASKKVENGNTTLQMLFCPSVCCVRSLWASRLALG